MEVFVYAFSPFTKDPTPAPVMLSKQKRYNKQLLQVTEAPQVPLTTQEHHGGDDSLDGYGDLINNSSPVSWHFTI